MASRLGRQIARVVVSWRQAVGTPATRRVAATPCGVDPVARVRVDDLYRQIERLEGRLNLILAAIVGTLVVDVLKAFVK